MHRPDRLAAGQPIPRLSPNVAVRAGGWKLLVNAEGTGAGLYDLAANAKEARDRRAGRPDVTKRLTERALKWRKSLP